MSNLQQARKPRTTVTFNPTANTHNVIIATILGEEIRSALLVSAYVPIQASTIAMIFREDVHPALIVSAHIAVQAKAAALAAPILAIVRHPGSGGC